MVNVTEDSPLVLECEGPAPVTWDSHRYIGTQREVITSPTNNAGEQRSWLIYRNATRSDPRVTCKTGSGSCAHMHYSVIVFSECNLCTGNIIIIGNIPIWHTVILHGQ